MVHRLLSTLLSGVAISSIAGHSLPIKAESGAGNSPVSSQSSQATADPPAVAPANAPSAPTQTPIPAGNPINSLQFLGTGELGRMLGLSPDSALRIGGVGVINGTSPWQGGLPAAAATAGGFLALSASLDLDKAIGWKGAKIAVAGLQYNVQPTNANAGSLQGIVSSDAAGPNDRTELYNYLFAQNLFDDQLQ